MVMNMMFSLPVQKNRHLPELITTRQDGDDPVKKIASQGNILVLHLHLDIFLINGCVLAVNMQSTLINRTSPVKRKQQRVDRDLVS